MAWRRSGVRVPSGPPKKPFIVMVSGFFVLFGNVGNGARHVHYAHGSDKEDHTGTQDGAGNYQGDA
jgi:hypothetical protein